MDIAYFNKCETTWTEAEYKHALALINDLEEVAAATYHGTVADNCWDLSDLLRDGVDRYEERKVVEANQRFLKTL